MAQGLTPEELALLEQRAEEIIRSRPESNSQTQQPSQQQPQPTQTRIALGDQMFEFSDPTAAGKQFQTWAAEVQQKAIE